MSVTKFYVPAVNSNLNQFFAFWSKLLIDLWHAEKFIEVRLDVAIPAFPFSGLLQIKLVEFSKLVGQLNGRSYR